MLERGMQEIWVRIESWMRANAPKVLDVLQPGASDVKNGTPMARLRTDSTIAPFSSHANPRSL